MEKQKSVAFNKEVYLLGKDKDGVYYWLDKGKWDCSWYWGFGYVSTYTNNEKPSDSKDITSHQHFDSLFLKKDVCNSFENFFEETVLNKAEIWQLLELMKTFYILQKTAELYHRGGAYITRNPCAELLKNEQEEKRINEELIPQILFKIYELLSPKQ